MTFHVGRRVTGWLRRRLDRWAVVLVLPAPAMPGGQLITPLSKHATRTAALIRVDLLRDDLAAGNEPAVEKALAEGGYVRTARLDRWGFIAGEVTTTEEAIRAR